MPQPAPTLNPYLRTKVLTASREELRLMLFDGALRFCRTGREAIQANDYEAVYENMHKAQKIVLELSSSLNHELMPDLCEKLASLYTYIYRLLVDATMDRRVDKVDEAIRLLDYERDTWVMLMDNLGKDPAGDATPPRPPAVPNPAAAYGQGGEPPTTYSRSA